MGCTAREKDIRNKRRLRSNQPTAMSVGRGEKLHHDRRNSNLAEKAPKPMKMLDRGSGEDNPKDKELGCGEGDDSDWGYCTEEQLEDLLLKSLEFVFNEAVYKIASEGYSGEEALNAVLRSKGLYGAGDLLSEIVENAIPYLNEDSMSRSSGADIVFRDLKQLEEYALEGMVRMLRQIKPQLSRGDALWCLLMSNLHVGRASTLEIPTLPPMDERIIVKSNANGPSPSTGVTMSSASRPSRSSPYSMPIGPALEPPGMCAQTKKTSGSNVVQADSAVVNTNNFMPDGGTSQKPTSTAQFTPNACIPPSMKLSLSRMNTAIILPQPLSDWKCNSNLCSQSNGTNTEGLVSACRPGKVQTQLGNSSEENQQLTQDVNALTENAADATSVVAAAKQLSMGLAFPVETRQDQYSEKLRSFPDIVGAVLGSLEEMGITEKSDGVDQRNEIILKLMRKIKDLEIQLKDRTQWAQQRAIQAATKLSKDLAELKSLRLERDETLCLKKDKQTLEDITMKRLAEMENALRKASGQVDGANAAVRRLEAENAEVRAEMEASKLSAAESAATCHEVEKKEKKFIRRVQTWEKQKSKLQDEISDVKQEITQIEQQLSVVRNMQQETEAKWKQVEKSKEMAIAQADDERRDKEATEASARRMEEALHRKTEMEFQRYKDDTERLEQELACLKAKAESCQPNTFPNAPYAVIEDKVRNLKDTNARLLCKLQELQESSRREGKRDRECVICKNEEVSVLFLPCAHQIVCVKCNDLHEKKDSNVCPSCKCQIKQRIHVYGVSS